MSDGTIHAEGDEMSTSYTVGGYTPAAERASTTQSGLDVHTFAEWLPRLGTVLWFYREPKDPVFSARATHVSRRSAAGTPRIRGTRELHRHPRAQFDNDARTARVARYRCRQRDHRTIVPIA